MKQWFVYIMASGRNGTLYIGVTNDLARRGSEPTTNAVHGSFTAKYDVHQMVYCEALDSPEDAIRREKNIKAWKRAWKVRLIESVNPQWEDLGTKLLD